MANAYIIRQATLCLVVGVPASGKSSLAQKISSELVNGAYLSKDLIQSAFTTTERVEGKTYALVRGPVFNILVDYAEVQLAHGKVPVIDAPFSINHWRQDKYSEWVTPFREVAEKHKARLAIVRCVPPGEEELRKRIETRRYPWDKWKLENWEEFLRREPLYFPINHDHVYEAVSDRPLEEMTSGALKFLGAVPLEKRGSFNRC